jgi:mono/diheme cytochrome c family protein
MVRLAFVFSILLAACTTSPSAPNLSEQERAGYQVFMSSCAACHAVEGDTRIVGPSLAGIATTASTRVDGLDAEAYIRQSILEPSAYINEGYQDIMPPALGQSLSSEQLDSLVAFLLTLH